MRARTPQPCNSLEVANPVSICFMTLSCGVLNDDVKSGFQVQGVGNKEAPQICDSVRRLRTWRRSPPANRNTTTVSNSHGGDPLEDRATDQLS